MNHPPITINPKTTNKIKAVVLSPANNKSNRKRIINKGVISICFSLFYLICKSNTINPYYKTFLVKRIIIYLTLKTCIYGNFTLSLSSQLITRPNVLT